MHFSAMILCTFFHIITHRDVVKRNVATNLLVSSQTSVNMNTLIESFNDNPHFEFHKLYCFRLSIFPSVYI